MLTFLAAIIVCTNSVTFTTKATGIDGAVPVEFVIAGPDSDRDYESLFITDDSLTDIVKAFKKAGIPTGKPYDPVQCNLWPVGSVVQIEPNIDSLIKIKDDANYHLRQVVYTGGNGDTNMPLAVFSTYTCGQTLFTFDDSLEQSVAYGKFFSAKTWKQNEPVQFKVVWNGKMTVDSTPDFPGDKTVGEAVKYARAIQLADTCDSKVNGFKDGQFFYQAFLPKEQWRDRKERLVQPIEIRVTETNFVCTLIDEDWSVDGPDPKLTTRIVDLSQAVKEKAKHTDTVFFFVPSGLKLSRLYDIKRKIPDSYRNFYVYVD